MTETILTAAGVQHRQGRFPRPPGDHYAVYFDDVTVDAPDQVTPPTAAGLPRILHHAATIELYETKPAPELEANLEAEMDARAIAWTKQDRFWLQDVQRYQVIYEFTYTEKRR